MEDTLGAVEVIIRWTGLFVVCLGIPISFFRIGKTIKWTRGMFTWDLVQYGAILFLVGRSFGWW
jgi:hypothetical protein